MASKCKDKTGRCWRGLLMFANTMRQSVSQGITPHSRRTERKRPARTALANELHRQQKHASVTQMHIANPRALLWSYLPRLSGTRVLRMAELQKTRTGGQLVRMLRQISVFLSWNIVTTHLLHRVALRALGLENLCSRLGRHYCVSLQA